MRSKWLRRCTAFFSGSLARPPPCTDRPAGQQRQGRPTTQSWTPMGNLHFPFLINPVTVHDCYQCKDHSRHYCIRHLNLPVTELPHAILTRLCHDLIHLIRPKLQVLTHVIFISGSIVYASYSSLVAADVIEDRLNDMRQHTKLCHHRRRSSAEVVKPPGLRQRHSPIKRHLWAMPATNREAVN